VSKRHASPQLPRPNNRKKPKRSGNQYPQNHPGKLTTKAINGVILLPSIWAQFYLTVKYGFKAGYLASAKDLFTKQEADLAVQLAQMRKAAVVCLVLLIDV
jgi:hypothetical protein